ATADQLAAFRKNPGLPPDRRWPSGFLRHADEQTVASMLVMSQALTALGQPWVTYESWGVIAANTLFGRAGLCRSFVDYCRDGAWGVSPHLIPQSSLHAPSGTISQAIGMHGPNFGVSSGPRAVNEAFLASATLLSEMDLPGLWVVFTDYDQELIP